jgi:hypothetical protein
MNAVPEGVLQHVLSMLSNARDVAACACACVCRPLTRLRAVPPGARLPAERL